MPFKSRASRIIRRNAVACTNRARSSESVGGGCFLVVFNFRAPGGKKARQKATARKDRKEGRREGRKEGKYGGRAGRKEGGRAGRKEGRDRIFVHICAGNTGSNITFC